MAYLLQHACALLFLATILCLPGILIERFWVHDVRLGALRLLARIVLGLGFWIACLFLLAVAGGLRPWILRGLIALVITGAVAAWGHSGWRIRRPALPPATTLGGLALLAAILTPLFLLAANPPVSWDANVYHLTLPDLFLVGRWVLLTGFLESGWSFRSQSPPCHKQVKQLKCGNRRKH